MRVALLVGGLILAAVLALLMPRRAAAAEGRAVTLNELYAKHADALGIDWRLVKAVAQVESSENPRAVNAADRESIGLMQVLCRPDGKGGCANRFDVDGWSEATRERLFDPDFNIWIGAQILAWNIGRYGVRKGIAVYNAWDQRSAPDAGPFKNQGYVDKVLAKARALGWED